MVIMKMAHKSCPQCMHMKVVSHHEFPRGANHRYCKNIAGGLVGSSKLNEIVDWTQNKVPKQRDKILILSLYRVGVFLVMTMESIALVSMVMLTVVHLLESWNIPSQTVRFSLQVVALHSTLWR
jgi:hypothetical protein